MAFFEIISNDEYITETKYKQNKYSAVYKEMEEMKVGECAKKEVESNTRARTIRYSIMRTLDRKDDDRFEISAIGNCIYVRRLR